MGGSFAMGKIKKSEWAAAAAAAFVFVVGNCMFENRKERFWQNDSFWSFVISAAAFFGAALCIMIFKDLRFSALSAVIGCVISGVCCRFSAPLAFCVFLPSLLLLFAQRLLATEETPEPVPPALPAAVFSGLSVYLAAAMFFLIRTLFFSQVQFYFFSVRYNDRMYGIWPLLLLFIGFVAAAVGSRIFSEREADAHHGKQTENKKDRNKKARAHGKRKSPNARLLVFDFIVSVVYFIDLILAYMALQQKGDRLLPYPMVIDLSAVFFCLAFLGRLYRRKKV